MSAMRPSSCGCTSCSLALAAVRPRYPGARTERQRSGPLPTRALSSGAAGRLSSRAVRGGSAAVAVIAVAAFAGGCGSSSAPPTKATSTGSKNCQTDSTSGVTSCTEPISRQTFHGTWPFTVSHGTLECDQPQSVYFTDPNGTSYGVNGTALDHGAKPVAPIWEKDPTGAAPRVYLGDVIDAGLKLCGQ